MERFPLPCPQHPNSVGVWCCTRTGFTDSFPLHPPAQTQAFPIPSCSVSAARCTGVFFWGCDRYTPVFSSSSCSSQRGLTRRCVRRTGSDRRKAGVFTFQRLPLCSLKQNRGRKVMFKPISRGPSQPFSLGWGGWSWLEPVPGGATLLTGAAGRKTQRDHYLCCFIVFNNE